MNGKHTLRRLLVVLSLVFLVTILVPERVAATIIIEKALPMDPVRSPFGIAVAKNSSFVVFAEKHTGRIGFLGTGQCQLNGIFNYTFSEFLLPGVDGTTAEPRDVALGNLTLRSTDPYDKELFVWFTEFVRNRIGRVSLATGLMAEYAIPTPNSGPMNLAIDPYSGSVWFTEYQANKIGRLFYVPSLNAWRFIEYSLPTVNSYPTDIAVDSNYWHTAGGEVQTYVWFTMSGSDKIGRLNGETGEVVEFSTRGTPWGIVVTRESFVWFTQKLGDRLAKLNPWTDVITEVSLPVHSPGNEPMYLVDDIDGALWFTESATNMIGRYVPGTNVFQEWAVPTTASKPHGIAVTPRLWGSGLQVSPINHVGTICAFFTEEVGNKIGKIIMPSGPWTTTTTVGWISSASTTTTSATTITTAATSTATANTNTPTAVATHSTTSYGESSTTLTDTVSILQTSTTSTWTKTTTSTSTSTTTWTSTTVTTTTSTTVTTTTFTSTSTTTSSSTTSTTTTTSTTYTSTSYSPTITTSTTFSTTSTCQTTTTTTTTSTVASISQVLLATSTTTTVTVTTTPARACMIASVAYGSDLAPEVQFLRGFRDDAVMSTFAGSQFMRVFNAFYYSFSPRVAELTGSSPILQGIARALIYPLVASLRAAATVGQLYPQASQLMIVVAGVLASSLVGAIYISPVVILLKAFERKMKASGGV